MRLSLAAGVFFSLTHCYRPHRVVIEQAASDLHCAGDGLAVTELWANQYMVKGCGQEHLYGVGGEWGTVWSAACRSADAFTGRRFEDAAAQETFCATLEPWVQGEAEPNLGGMLCAGEIPLEALGACKSARDLLPFYCAEEEGAGNCRRYIATELEIACKLETRDALEQRCQRLVDRMNFKLEGPQRYIAP
jgi:hypothetical protein